MSSDPSNPPGMAPIPRREADAHAASAPSDVSTPLPAHGLTGQSMPPPLALPYIQPNPAAPPHVQAYAQPAIPVASWVSPSYQMSHAWRPNQRPGIVTAIGVTSIIVASISLLGSLGNVTYATWVLKMTRMSSAMWATRQAAASSSIASPANIPAPLPAGPEMGPEGMSESDRGAVAQALSSVEEISPVRYRQLIAILAMSGKVIFPSEYGAVTHERVKMSLRDHGTMPSADASDIEPLFFDTPTGHLQLYNDRAVFRPYDPTAPVVRKSAGPEAEATAEDPATAAPAATQPEAPKIAQASAVSPPGKVDPFASDDDPTSPQPQAGNPPSAQTAANAPLPAPGTIGGPAAVASAPVPRGAGAFSAAQVAGIVQKVQAAAGNRLSASQVASLTSSLQAPSQQLVTPGTLWSPVSLVNIQPDGSAVIKLSGGYLWIDAQGQIQDQGALVPRIAVHPLSVAVVMAESIVSVALAVFLLLIGIFALRRSTKAGRLHWVYALVKLPVAIGGVIGFVWMSDSLFSSLPQAAGPGSVMRTIGITGGVLALVYPIVLLFVLRARSVREYYRATSVEM